MIKAASRQTRVAIDSGYYKKLRGNKMRILSVAASALLYSLTSFAVEANTYTYDFAMPAFVLWEDLAAEQSLVGRSSTLRLVLDNGNDTNLNQTYGLSSILSAQVVSVEGTGLSTGALGIQFKGFGIPGFADDADLITTDSEGSALLDTDQPGLAAVTFGNFPDFGIQLAAAAEERNSGGPCTYSIRIGTNTGYRCTDDEIFQATGTLTTPVLTPVPLPAAGWVLFSGLIAMYTLRERSPLRLLRK